MSALNGACTLAHLFFFPTLASPFPTEQRFLLLNSRTRVLESIKSGKRLPEAKFANLKLATKGQQSVYGAFSNACSKNLAAQGATPASKAKSRSL